MVQTLVVVLEHGRTLLLARVILGRRVDDIAGEDLLPEGKASAGACECRLHGLAVAALAVDWDFVGDRPPCKPYPEAMAAMGERTLDEFCGLEG